MSHFIIKHNVPGIAFNRLVKTDKKGNVTWMMEKENWGFDWDSDRYFSEADIEALESKLKNFIKSEFCEVIEV